MPIGSRVQFVAAQPSSGIPDPIKDLSREGSLVPREKASVMLRDHLGSILNSVTRLLVRSRLLQDMSRDDVADVVRPAWQQTHDCPRLV